MSELIHQFLIPFVLLLLLRRHGAGVQGLESVQPLLFVLPLLHRMIHFLPPLQQLLAVRGPLYLATAHYVVDAARQNASQVSRKIGMQAELAGLLTGQGSPGAAAD